MPLLYNLSERQLWQLARAMGTARFTKGQMVFAKGDPGDMFYVVQDGAFTCFDGGRPGGLGWAAQGPAQWQSTCELFQGPAAPGTGCDRVRLPFSGPSWR